MLGRTRDDENSHIFGIQGGLLRNLLEHIKMGSERNLRPWYVKLPFSTNQTSMHDRIFALFFFLRGVLNVLGL